MELPTDYFERVYAGVLGKIIGVYLGRPFENWSYERISAELGEISYYVNEKLNAPLVVTDDDINGTFTFLRALEDYPIGRDITPAQIGATWMNYIVLNRSILWWGGMGNSTEHTAYLRMKHGMMPPESGSIAANGKTIAEQIGSQIFIDGWGMISPGDPELAVDFARKASCVSHDGEAIYGAQIIAAIEAQAFVESDLGALLDCAVSFIPHDSIIYRLIADLRNWRETVSDWRKARELIVLNYGYDKYGGNCHIVPNHALIHLGLLYGENNFQKSMMITNTSGWDTDCNSGNLGCILGIKNGLAGINTGPDWRGPVADRIYLPTADGGRCITDAVQQSVRIINHARELNNFEPIAPKSGARFHFDFPGAVQGFESHSPELTIENISGHSANGEYSLAFHIRDLNPIQRVRGTTDTFIRPEALDMPGYHLHASPTLYPGQTVRAGVTADASNRNPIHTHLCISIYDENDHAKNITGPGKTLAPGESHELIWQIDTEGELPIYAVGIDMHVDQETSGTIYLDYLTWDNVPTIVFTRPNQPGKIWQRAWVFATDHSLMRPHDPLKPVQNEGRGLVIQGTRDWRNYRVSADIQPLLCSGAGIVAYVQGLRRYYALIIRHDSSINLIKVIDGREIVLATKVVDWLQERKYELALEVVQKRIRAFLDAQLVFSIYDDDSPLLHGSVGLLVEDGCSFSEKLQVNLPSRS